eukprot:2722668-Pyramimonas_sp.AAC.1
MVSWRLRGSLGPSGDNKFPWGTRWQADALFEVPTVNALLPEVDLALHGQRRDRTVTPAT